MQDDSTRHGRSRLHCRRRLQLGPTRLSKADHLLEFTPVHACRAAMPLCRLRPGPIRSIEELGSGTRINERVLRLYAGSLTRRSSGNPCDVRVGARRPLPPGMRDATPAFRQERATDARVGWCRALYEPRRHSAAEKRTRPRARSTDSTSRPEPSHARAWTCREPAVSFAHQAGHLAADAGRPPTSRPISSNVISRGPSSTRQRCSRSGSYFATAHHAP